MSKKYLAYISPIESIINKENVVCNVTFITGDLDHQTFRYNIPTNFFTYYFYGSALEVIELDSNKQIINIHDITKEDAEEFNIFLYNVLTLNKNTFDMLVSNNFTYNLKQNKFYNYCRQTVENMYIAMQNTNSFVLRTYIQNGAIIYIELDTLSVKDSKYTMSSGFIVQDKSQLKQSITFSSNSNIDKNKKLSQEDINKLITKLTE